MHIKSFHSMLIQLPVSIIFGPRFYYRWRGKLRRIYREMSNQSDRRHRGSDLHVYWNQRCLAVPAKSGLSTAVGKMGNAYTAAAGRTATDATYVAAEMLTGSPPGVYEWRLAVKNPTHLLLNCSATEVWNSTYGGNPYYGHC